MATKKATSSNNKRKRGRPSKAELQKRIEKNDLFYKEVYLWGIIAVSALLFISNFHIGGIVGEIISDFFFGMFGLIAYIFPILLLIGSFFVVSNRGNTTAKIKLIGSIIFIIMVCLFMTLLFNGDSLKSPYEAYKYGTIYRLGGGLIGGILECVLCPAFGLIGAYIIDFIMIIISLIFITGKSVMKKFKKSGKKVYESAKNTSIKYQEFRQEQKELSKLRSDNKVKGVSMNTLLKPFSKENNDLDETFNLKNASSDELEEVKMGNLPEVISKVQSEVEAVFPADPQKADLILDDNLVIQGDFASVSSKNNEPDTNSYDNEKKNIFSSSKADLSNNNNEQIFNNMSSVLSGKDTGLDKIDVSENSKKEYRFPPIDLLKKNKTKKNSNNESSLRETAALLQLTLKNFGVDVTVTNISCGPSVTRYEVQPEMGVKVSKIVNLADDIKLNLAASDIRIEAPIPGKAAVGIEVPNKENQMVSFRELIESKEFSEAESMLSFAVGKDIAGKTKVADISKMPHVLIAGATGSGKSVCINTIIMSILYKAKPDDVKLIMIDPKVVELSVYNGLPHLLIPVVTDPKKASGALNWAVAEMTERYNKFAETGVREIRGYNRFVEKQKKKSQDCIYEKMPQIVIIVDELADLMMVASNDVEEAICRLAQLARAAGIHLVIATQRPSVNVITGLIKANMPSRIAFSVTSGVDSRTILDMNGAEKLLGKGDMLFYPQGIPKPLRVQGAFVSDEEVQNVVEFLTDENGTAEYSQDIQDKVQSHDGSNSSSSNGNSDDRDSYFMDAADIVMDKEKASIGMLQRYLKIGFNRAARIMDQLEEAGIVGPEEGTKPRKIIISKEEYLSLKNH
ncbi:FtsK/SpoIIIE family DNA translocase [Lachnobacterium bovis]|uniref:DNA segregation ATPase FtsK/SpoIIIE, S-DNA-T family n=1 Tax=Lachnobacterium bovis TaxID=140626 RepID=A0A1H9Q0X6_9FIRM|nr:DNA translocase FtsK [Lachnobacterium bovis]SER54052.1 DNA segregation ATPase FtsK/SpoIIIE, S-DNA-T family [Lachnobacterium bovis]